MGLDEVRHVDAFPLSNVPSNMPFPEHVGVAADTVMVDGVQSVKLLPYDIVVVTGGKVGQMTEVEVPET